MNSSRIVLAFGILLSAAIPVRAHPIAGRSYERTVVVHLTASGAVVEYHLVLEETTALLDLLALRDKTNLADLKTRKQIREAFLNAYTPILADNLVGALNQKPLDFRCTKSETSLVEGHIRCDLTFTSDWLLKRGDGERFEFRDGNYENEVGLLFLSLSNDESIVISESTAPDEALQSLSPLDRKPGDEDRLRTVHASFTVSSAEGPVSNALPPDESGQTPATENETNDLLALLLDSKQGLWVLLLLACFFGAGHALTPGHGKTLVAAYLVGERGTVWHAVLLGLITTLTHTGAVLVLAAVLLWFFPNSPPAQVQFVLGVVGGLLVAGMGLWLLFRRLSGQADHIHIGGHGHHHHHGHHGHDHQHCQDKVSDHFHDADGRVRPSTNGSPGIGSWGLIVLGVTGGIVPCWDAILMFGFAVAMHRIWLGLPLLLAFSAGLAGVLILIGIFVVKAKGFAGSRWGDSRLFRMLPVASAALVTVIGLWLCYTSVHQEKRIEQQKHSRISEATG